MLEFLPLLQVINERNILGTQLVRRNDELALLHEKIRIHQSTLDKGETQYTQRLEDIRILKIEIKKMRREKNMLTRSVANVEDLRYDRPPEGCRVSCSFDHPSIDKALV